MEKVETEEVVSPSINQPGKVDEEVNSPSKKHQEDDVVDAPEKKDTDVEVKKGKQKETQPESTLRWPKDPKKSGTPSKPRYLPPKLTLPTSSLLSQASPSLAPLMLSPRSPMVTSMQNGASPRNSMYPPPMVPLSQQFLAGGVPFSMPFGVVSVPMMQTTQDRCNVFVKYLPPEMRDDGLYELFSPCGNIISCKVMVEHKTDTSLGYGFVKFSTPEEAIRAIEQMSGQQLGSKTLLCKLSNCTPTASVAPSNNLYIKPLLEDTTEEQLKALFSIFGKVEECRVMKDKKTGRSKQIGFVRFSMMHEATAALKRMNGSRLSPESPPLIVKYAESESQKSARRAQNFVPSPRVATPYFSFPQQVGLSPGTIYQPVAVPCFAPGIGMQMSYAPAIRNFSNLYQPSHQAATHGPYGGKNESSNLFVFHLPSDVDDEQLAHLFSPFGEIESVKVVCDRETGESKGYGFVKYYRLADAVNAVAYMNGMAVGNKHLKVAFKTNAGNN